MSSNLTRNPNLDLSAPAAVNLSARSRPLLVPRDASWWTGPNPNDRDCPGRTEGGWITALPAPNLSTCEAAEVLAYFANGWVLTELLFAALNDEDAFYRPPYHGLRHPLVFYYVHPAVLYVNKLHVAGLLPETPNSSFERIFETGVDEMSWDDLSKNEMDWPDLETCRAYRREVFAIVSELIAHHAGLRPGHGPITPDSPLWALFMSIEHERIHLETTSVLMRELPVRLVQRPPQFAPLPPMARPHSGKTWVVPVAGRDYPLAQWQAMPAATVTIGKERLHPSYGWDNEYGSAERQVAAFSVQEHPVTNGAYYEFVRSGGYREQRYWSEDGWRWRGFRNVKWPTFWIPSGAQGAHEYALRTCLEVIDMPWDWPVIVNYYEAKAYAAWLAAQQNRPLRLLTEAEHHRLRSWESTPANDHLQWSSETTVRRDVFGNVWQWLEDHFHPLPGFAAHPYYDDFSTPCFDGRHQMIAGGSFISIGDEASSHARFHFRPHFFQHAGFRLVDALDPRNDGAVQHIHSHLKIEGFDWTADQIERGFALMAQALRPFWDQLADRAPAARLPKEKLFTETTPPEKGEDLRLILNQVVQDLGQHDELIGHPGYLAYVAGAAQPIAAIGQALAMLMNPYTGTFGTAPSAVQLEEQVISWLLHMMGFPEDGAGWITSGSSLAIFSAVIAARQSRPAPVGRRRVYVSDQSHHSIGKALFAAGFASAETCVIPSENGRMSVTLLRQRILRDRQEGFHPILLFATAGTTNCGRVDPLNELADLAAKEDLWYHIDAAYGGFFRLDPTCTILAGMERADSLSLDPHKSLYMPYGTGVLLVRERSALEWPRSLESSYMPPPSLEETNYTDISPELSRDFRGLRLWLSLKTFGLQTYRETLQEKRRLAQNLAAWIRAQPRLELTHEPDLSLLTFRVKQDEGDKKTQALLKMINDGGRFYLTSCRMDKRLHIRVCILGFRTREANVQKLKESLQESLTRI